MSVKSAAMQPVLERKHGDTTSRWNRNAQETRRTTPTLTTGLKLDSTTIPTFGAWRRPLLRRLKVGHSNDPLEHEADQMAENALQNSKQPDGGSSCTSCHANHECSGCKKRREQQGAVLRRYETGPITPVEGSPAPLVVDEVLREPGQPLSASVRSFFDHGFGRDFSAVRVHTSAKAAVSSQAVAAQAFTADRHIVFNAGSYAPHTDEGRRLLAHELAHVVQQGAAGLPLGGSVGVADYAPSVQAARSVQRQPSTPVCITGKQEGTGENIKPPITVSGLTISYVIWGVWNTEDNNNTFTDRVLNRWAQWRFGALPAETRSRIVALLQHERKDAAPTHPAGCCYTLGLTPATYVKAREISGEVDREKTEKAAAPPANPDHSTQSITDTQKGGEAAPPTTAETKVARAERGERVTGHWKVLDGNEPLSRKYLDEMEHFAGMPKTAQAVALTANGLTVEEVKSLVDDNARYKYFTDLITQGWAEFSAAGSTDLDAFSVLMEAILQQFRWGNPNATGNLLKIGKPTSGLPSEAGILGITHRRSGELLYGADGQPLMSISGMKQRDDGYVAAKQPSWGLNIGEISDPGLRSLLNTLRLTFSEPTRMAEQAAEVLYENIDLVKPRVAKGLTAEVIKKFEDALPLFVGFLAGHGVSQLLVMSSNPQLIAIGGVLKGLLTAAGYLMDIDFAASAIDRLLTAARYLSRVSRDDQGKLTSLSYQYLDSAAVPLRDMVADLAMLTAFKAFGRLMGAIKGEGGESVGKERPRIACHSCEVEPKPGETAETKPSENAGDRPGTEKEAAPQGEKSKAEQRAAESAARKEKLTGKIGELEDRRIQIQLEIDAIDKRLKELPPGEEKSSLIQEKADLIRERSQTSTEQSGLKDQISRLGRALYLACRVFSMFENVRKDVLDKATAKDVSTGKVEFIDKVSNKVTSDPTVDHIVSVDEISQMEGFRELGDFERTGELSQAQKEVLSTRTNLITMDRGLNSSKGNQSWATWELGRKIYGDTRANEMFKIEQKQRSDIQKDIKDRLKNRIR